MCVCVCVCARVVCLQMVVKRTEKEYDLRKLKVALRRISVHNKIIIDSELVQNKIVFYLHMTLFDN